VDNKIEGVISTIDRRIAEHKKEIENIAIELDSLRKTGKSGMDLAMKQIILKDKTMFHKACYMTLEDLKIEISK